MKTINALLLILFFTAVVFSGCKKDDSTVDNSDVDYSNAVNSTGGIMYDKFWSTESGFDQNDANYSTYSDHGDFFRCKQCHGWDGLGSKGAYISRGPKATRPNVSSINLYEFAKSKTPKELFDAMKATTNRRDISNDLSSYDPATNNTEGDKMPDYGQILTDAQIWDIVKFMNEGMFDVSKLYDATYTGTYPNGSASFSNVGLDGNATTGATFYSTDCAACHGVDGTSIDLEGRTIGKFAREKSNEMQHKVKYGQLGSDMVGEFDMTLEQMKDLYKALADTDAFPDEAPVTGDAAIGGIMYDKFWSVESGFDQNDPNMATLSASGDFFRCKQCHGWDGLGSNGAYISRGPKTTRPNVSGLNLYQLAQNSTGQELFDAMKETTNRRDISYDLSTYDPATNNVEGDKMPNFNQLLSDDQIWGIVKFMKDGMFDVSALYDATYTGTYPTGSATFANVGLDGNPANGASFYSSNCAACHGSTGTQIDLEGRTIGKFTREKPNEMQHKVKYGQLGSTMTGEFDLSQDSMKDLYKACADPVAFPD